MLLGSGELGKEFTIAAKRAGQYVIACDKYDNAPAMQVADEREVFSMLDGDALTAVVEKHHPDIIVPEIEAIRTERLFDFEKEGIQVVPSARAVNYTMNRRAIRDLAAKELGLRTAKYFYAKTFEEFKNAADEIGFPCVVKPLMSSSGHGQSYVHNDDELKEVKSLAFRRMMMAEIDRSIPESLFRFAWSKLKNDADFEQFAESFDRNDPDNLGIAAKYLRHYLRHHPAPEREKDIHYLNSLKQVFSDQEVINAFADEYIQSYLKQAPDNMEEVYKLYSNISTNPEARALADDMYAHYVKLRKGAPAIDFEMTDAKGKKFRLSDFHGKAVYIDVWATWCGPCCAEIPHMEKLAAHYAKNKKIVLLSISLDKNKAKWEKKLAEDKPQWRQFICLDAFDSEVCKNYGINAIPRFLFFDKDGKVISLDAPRPSSAKITEYIDRHIR